MSDYTVQVVARVTKLLDNKGLTYSEIGRILNITAQAARGYFTTNRTRPSKALLKALPILLPGINMEWVMTGKGEPYNHGAVNDKNLITTILETVSSETTQLRPLHNEDFIMLPMFSLSTFHKRQSIGQFAFLPIPDVSKEHLANAVAIDIDGAAMMPTLQPGEIIVVSPIPASEYKNLLPDIYLFELEDSTLVRSIENNTFESGFQALKAENKSFPPLTIELTQIKAVWQILTKTLVWNRRR